jgi:hypothetical protein
MCGCAQCVLQLSPATPCDQGMTAFAALTFVAFTILAVLAAWVLTALYSSHRLAQFINSPYEARWSRGLFVVPLRFGRKLWFSALMSVWPFSDPSRSDQLALVIFVSIVILLTLQLWLRPYADTRDNTLEVACLLLLMYGYFVSVLAGASGTTDTSVKVLQALLLSYGLARWAQSRMTSPAASEQDAQSAHAQGRARASSFGSGTASELTIELLAMEDRAELSASHS